MEIATSRSAAILPKAAQRFSFHGNPEVKANSNAVCLRATSPSRKAASSPSSGGSPEMPKRIT